MRGNEWNTCGSQQLVLHSRPRVRGAFLWCHLMIDLFHSTLKWKKKQPCAGYLAYLFQIKSAHDGFTRSISTSSKHQVGDEKVPYMPVSSLVLEQISYIAGTRSEFMIL